MRFLVPVMGKFSVVSRLYREKGIALRLESGPAIPS